MEMRRKSVARFVMLGVAAVVATVAIGFVFGFAVMWLWNWLMPDLFGLRPIGFWQAFGLLLLARLLFGGVRGGSGRHMRWRHRMRERWERMTPEERERFREGLRGCGRPAPTDSVPGV
jgi:hypothetical protein